MIRQAVIAGLVGLGAALPARAAADPASVAAVEQFLRDDEKAMLAGVLADASAASDFNADVKLASGDAKVMKLVLDKWRGRVVAFAEAGTRAATPNLDGSYKNASAMMTPQIRAYLLRRLKTMKDDDRNTLITYLEAVDSALSSNDGKLTWYAKKVVTGIFDKYRQDLGTYLPEPIARTAKASAPAAALTLAQLQRSSEATLASAAPSPSRKPVAAPRAAAPRAPSSAADSAAPAAALEQARQAAEAAERSGANFDGGGATPPEADGVAAGTGGADRRALAPSSRSDGAPNVAVEVPSPIDSDNGFMASLESMHTGPGRPSPFRSLSQAGGGVIGALVGFLLGGPIGALIGAGAGFITGSKLFS